MVEITLGIISYMLSLDTTICMNLNEEDDFPVDTFLWWAEGLPQKNILYVLEKKDLLENLHLWKNKMVLCIGWLSEDELEGQDMKWISVSGRFQIQEILHQLQQIFQGYYQWYIRLQNSLYQQKDLNDVLTAVEKTFHIHSCISTYYMRIVGMSEEFQKSNSWVDKNRMAKFSLVSDLVLDEDFQAASDFDDVFEYLYYENQWYYCFNMKVNGKYQARLIANTNTHEKICGVKQIISELGRCLNSVYKDYHIGDPLIQASQEFCGCVQAILSGKAADMRDIQKLLGRYQWNRTHEYQVILIQFQLQASTGVGMQYFKDQISGMFHECYVAEEKNRFVCIRNLSRSGQEEGYGHLIYFLRETMCKAGISNVFNDFSKLYYYYLEAEHALLIGGRQDPTLWYYEFSQYVFSYLMENCVNELGVWQLVHPAILKLKEYDRKNHTLLLESLRIFLQEKQNTTRTARLLEVHRTTLLARLERIRYLTQINLEDYETCLHLMLSFEFIQRSIHTYG